jgi:hypothetical protein
MQILTLVATVLGIVMAVFNLVAFVREKDRGHLRAGLAALFLLALGLGLVLLPHFYPATARRIVARLPGPAARFLEPWANLSGPVLPALPAPTPAPLEGSFSIELRRNILGGIDSVVALFHFADLAGEGGRVTSWQIRIQPEEGGPSRSFRRVLPQPVEVPPRGTARAEAELDEEIRDVWLARRDQEKPGAIEVTWQGVDARGNRFSFSAADN